MGDMQRLPSTTGPIGGGQPQHSVIDLGHFASRPFQAHRVARAAIVSGLDNSPTFQFLGNTAITPGEQYPVNNGRSNLFLILDGTKAACLYQGRYSYQLFLHCAGEWPVQVPSDSFDSYGSRGSLVIGSVLPGAFSTLGPVTAVYSIDESRRPLALELDNELYEAINGEGRLGLPYLNACVIASAIRRLEFAGAHARSCASQASQIYGGHFDYGRQTADVQFKDGLAVLLGGEAKLSPQSKRLAGDSLDFGMSCAKDNLHSIAHLLNNPGLIELFSRTVDLIGAGEVKAEEFGVTLKLKALLGCDDTQATAIRDLLGLERYAGDIKSIGSAPAIDFLKTENADFSVFEKISR